MKTCVLSGKLLGHHSLTLDSAYIFRSKFFKKNLTTNLWILSSFPRNRAKLGPNWTFLSDHWDRSQAGLCNRLGSSWSRAALVSCRIVACQEKTKSVEWSHQAQQFGHPHRWDRWEQAPVATECQTLTEVNLSRPISGYGSAKPTENVCFHRPKSALLRHQVVHMQLKPTAATRQGLDTATKAASRPNRNPHSAAGQNVSPVLPILSATKLVQPVVPFGEWGSSNIRWNGVCTQFPLFFHSN